MSSRRIGVSGGVVKLKVEVAVHVLFQGGGDAFAEGGVPIERHEVKTDVGAAGDDGAEEERAAFVAGGASLEVVAATGVRVDVEMALVRREHVLRT